VAGGERDGRQRNASVAKTLSQPPQPPFTSFLSAAASAVARLAIAYQLTQLASYQSGCLKGPVDKAK